MGQKKYFWLFAVLITSLTAVSPSMAARRGGGPVLVGHVTHVEGELLYYVPADNDWVAATADVPFGREDAFYSGDNGKAAFVLPNRTRVRIGPMTQIQLIGINEELTQVDIASGMARFFDDSNHGIVKVTTPFGYVVADPGSSFDIYVGDQSTEVIPIIGRMYFVGNDGTTRYDIREGLSIIASAGAVSQGDNMVDGEWDAWNRHLDDARARRIHARSTEYLPAGLYDEAYVLDDYGRWDDVYYNGRERRLWRPNVDPGWEPFTYGRWTSYYGDYAWIPANEPFGYLTGHYGNWVRVGEPAGWYWLPPEDVAPAGPDYGVAFSWYPGRVGWLYNDTSVGWFPLAPSEPYYAHDYWGPRTVVVQDPTRVHISINDFRYAPLAVAVPQSSLFTVRDYREARIRRVDPNTLASNFRPAPVIDTRIIRNVSQPSLQYNFTPTPVERVPHSVVAQRIQQNQRLASQAANIRAAAVERQVARLRPAQVAQNVQVPPPRVSDRLVSRNEAARPVTTFPQRELKRQSVPVQAVQQREQELRQRAAQAQPAVPPGAGPQARQQALEQQRRQQALQAQQGQPGQVRPPVPPGAGPQARQQALEQQRRQQALQAQQGQPGQVRPPVPPGAGPQARQQALEQQRRQQALQAQGQQGQRGAEQQRNMQLQQQQRQQAIERQRQQQSQNQALQRQQQAQAQRQAQAQAQQRQQAIAQQQAQQRQQQAQAQRQAQAQAQQRQQAAAQQQAQQRQQQAQAQRQAQAQAQQRQQAAAQQQAQQRQQQIQAQRQAQAQAQQRQQAAAQQQAQQRQQQIQAQRQAQAQAQQQAQQRQQQAAAEQQRRQQQQVLTR